MEGAEALSSLARHGIEPGRSRAFTPQATLSRRTAPRCEMLAGGSEQVPVTHQRQESDMDGRQWKPGDRVAWSPVGATRSLPGRVVSNPEMVQPGAYGLQPGASTLVVGIVVDEDGECLTVGAENLQPEGEAV